MEKTFKLILERVHCIPFFQTRKHKGILISNLTVNKKGKTAFTKFEIA